MADKKISALTGATTPLAGTEVLPIVQSSTTKQVSVANLTVGRTVTALGFAATSSGNTELSASTSAGTPIISLIGASGSNPLIGYLGSGGIRIGPVTGTGAAGFSQQYLLGGTGDMTLNVGNLVLGTSGKGVNFTANTPQAGMTSQLLNWYEQGTWTPTRNNFTEVLGAGAITSTGTYTRVGNTVLVQVVLTCTGGATIASTNGAVSFFSGLPFTPATWTPGSWIESTLTSSGAMIAHPNTNFYVSTSWVAASKTWYFSSTYAV